MAKITVEDSVLSAIVKMAGGNPGSLGIMAAIVNDGARIDPDGGETMLTILGMDSFGLYGHRIWMLYKDVCKQNLSKMLACLRSVELGLVAKSAVDHAIENYGEGLDVDEVCRLVKKSLPNFQVEQS